MRQVNNQLKQLGFKMSSWDFGTIKPEAYDVGKDHFKPRYRSVFIGKIDWGKKKNHGYYITSNIVGLFRHYRQHKINEHSTELGNIFAFGTTLTKALDKFTYNFKHKIYNRRQA